MQLPGRLRTTSLGDLLGALHRARANGTLELAEGERTHRVFVSEGQVVAVEYDGSSSSLGEVLRSSRVVDDDVLRRSVLRSISSRRLLGDVLVHDFAIAPAVVGSALRRQITHRLEQIDKVHDARVSFRVTLRPPATALRDEPLRASEFLRGRKRARDRGESWSAPRIDPDRAAALRTLGLDYQEATNPDVIRRAYRRLAKTTHPDAFPHASEAERTELTTRFHHLTNAYTLLAKAS